MNNEEKPRRCHNCAHWEKSQSAMVGVSQGLCRFAPPSVVALPAQNGIQIVGHFPPTMGDCWCGCHAFKVAIEQTH